jgi:hypothetical protein
MPAARAWNGSWNASSDNPSAASAVIAMISVIGAGSGCATTNQASRNASLVGFPLAVASPSFGQFRRAAFTNPFTDWSADLRLLNLCRGFDREVRPSVAPWAACPVVLKMKMMKERWRHLPVGCGSRWA